MSIVKFSDLHNHAQQQAYKLPLIQAHASPLVKGILDCATQLNAPIALTVDGDQLENNVLPSIELMARQTPIPIALLAKNIQNATQATLAIRLGCNALLPADSLDEKKTVEIHQIAESCGIEQIQRDTLQNSCIEIDEELQLENLQITTQASSWKQLETQITEAVTTQLPEPLHQTGAPGHGQAASIACEPWQPIEHLIIYDTSCEEAESEKLAAEGLRVLDQIPGVRATWSGRAVKADVEYPWCWLIRFAHPAVIDSYREHPDHVAYADTHFRPVAGGRISIDYALTGAEEEQNRK